MREAGLKSKRNARRNGINVCVKKPRGEESNCEFRMGEEGVNA